MKTLNTIQTLSRIGRILSKIVNICSIVGFICYLVGAAMLGVGSDVSLKIGQFNFHTFIRNETGIADGTIWAAILSGVCLCVALYIISRMAYRYFENELKAGTPFTQEGAKELMHLGISMIWIPIVAVVVGWIAQCVLKQFVEGVEIIKTGNMVNAEIGVMFIIMALICRYGAEVRVQKK